MKNKLHLLPLVLFLVLAGFFVYRLILIEQGNVPKNMPSVMIGQPAPHSDLACIRSR